VLVSTKKRAFLNGCVQLYNEIILCSYDVDFFFARNINIFSAPNAAHSVTQKGKESRMCSSKNPL